MDLQWSWAIVVHFVYMATYIAVIGHFYFYPTEVSTPAIILTSILLGSILGGARGTGNIILSPLLGGTGVAPLVGALWVKATIVERTGTVVTRWNDLDPLQQDLTETVLGSEPEYVAVAVNGKPGVRFDNLGNDAIFITTNLLRQAGPNIEFTSGDPRTIYAVIIPEVWNEGASSGIGGGICSFRTTGVGQTIFAPDAFNWNNDNRFYAYRNASFDRTAPHVVGFGPTKPWLMKWIYDGVNIALYIDGVLQVLDNPLANPADSSVNPGFFLGRAGAIGEGHNGHQIIQEFRVFNGVLGIAQQAQYEADLTAEWGPF